MVGYRDLDRIGQTLAADPASAGRRTQVLDQLPERIDKQRLRADDARSSASITTENQEIVARIVQKWRRYKFLSEADQRRLMIALQNMRMSCDSTYLLDHETDHGAKADELVTLLGELLETAGHEGGRLQPVAADARAAGAPARSDAAGATSCSTAACRAASARTWSTASATTPTAGCSCPPTPAASGLNLQHASVVVNMDLPWNPAVLEQRIGRVHRLGQTAAGAGGQLRRQGTIEEGMLSVLQFKKSLFAGVLDGGERSVFLGGSRLTSSWRRSRRRRRRSRSQ